MAEEELSLEHELEQQPAEHKASLVRLDEVLLPDCTAEELLPGGEVAPKSEYGAVDNDEDEEDQSLLSITRTQSDSLEEDDDQILCSGEKMDNRSLETTHVIQNELHISIVDKIDTGNKVFISGREAASPCRSLSSVEVKIEVDSCICLSDPGKGHTDIDKQHTNIGSDLANTQGGLASPRTSLPGLGMPGQLDVIQETCSLEHGELSVSQAGNNVKRSVKKVLNGSKEAGTVALRASPGLFGLSGQFKNGIYENYVPKSAQRNSIYSSPENSTKVQVALTKNRQCQNMFQKLLLQVEQRQKENTELQRRMRTLIDFEKCCKRRFAGLLSNHKNLSIKLIKSSEPKLDKCRIGQPAETKVSLGPPSNEDVETFQKLQREFPSAFDLRKWSKHESEELKKGVTQQLQENLVRETMEALIMDKNPNDKPRNLDDMLKEVAEKIFTAEEIRKYLPNINWDHVARRYVAGRSAAECKIRWLNHEDRLMNNAVWTKVEDKRLLHVAQQHDLCDWEAISQQLNTNRTPAQCLMRYQRSLNATIMRSSWTPEEDEQLRMAVKFHGEKNWQAVAANIEGRTGPQCSNRWHKVVHPGRRSGRWNVEEDKRLTWAVSLYDSKQWNRIASHVPGRTDVQCRERWCNVLDPSLKREDWSKKEDKRLEEAVAKHGAHHWAAVANELKPRTDNQCWRRWRLLNPEHQAAFHKDVCIRRVALVPNFVGRKKERPSLGISDFFSEAYPAELESRPKNKPKKPKLKDKDLEETEKPQISAPLGHDNCNGTSVKVCHQISATLGHDDCNGTYAKVCRQARMERMRLSRAEGRLKRFARKEGMDEGASSRLISSRLIVEPSQVALDVSRLCHETALNPSAQGTLPLVSTVRSVAGSHKLHGDPCVSSENYAENARFISDRDQAVSSNNVSVDVHEKLRGWQENISERNRMPLSKQSKEEEVAAATQAVLSWPVVIGLPRFWNPNWENMINQSSEMPIKGTCQELHNSLSSSPFVKKRKQNTHNRPRQKKLVAPEKLVKDGEILDQGPVEAAIVPPQRSNKHLKPKRGALTEQVFSCEDKNEKRSGQEHDPVQAMTSKIHVNHENSALKLVQSRIQCTEDPCIVLETSRKKRKTFGLMDKSTASKKSKKA
ncbi:hypothetical protein O6H91_10G058000 [Diphasiastrum complanatum]|uniref:Uncharacterized protein n=1 Tax=Diphasiastrum complanatum TaxID=34168 RepID=A0ACC2CHH6_DIPCM|nr:hypothetical protein O6H91_10G058000 [Diphasiastrum complanatum]